MTLFALIERKNESLRKKKNGMKLISAISVSASKLIVISMVRADGTLVYFFF